MLSFRNANYSMNRIARHLRNVARRKGSLLLLFMISAALLTGTSAKEDGKLGEEDEDFGWNDEEPPDESVDSGVHDGGIPLVRKEEFTNNQLYAEAYQSYIQALACKLQEIFRSSWKVWQSLIEMFRSRPVSSSSRLVHGGRWIQDLVFLSCRWKSPS